MKRDEVLIKSKELVSKIYEKMNVIESCDSVAEKIKTLDVCFNDANNNQIVSLDGILHVEQLEEIREGVISKICDNASEAQLFLELLNRKPAVINPEFEAAVQEMVQSANPESDQVKGTAVEIQQQEIKHAERIEDTSNDDKSLDKYPASKKKFKLTNEDLPEIRRMYIDQNMTAREIADYFKIDDKRINNFINRRGLRRRSYARIKDKDQAETERP